MNLVKMGPIQLFRLYRASLIKRDEDIGSGFIDALEILARSVTKCEAKLKSEYTNLIS